MLVKDVGGGGAKRKPGGKSIFSNGSVSQKAPQTGPTLPNYTNLPKRSPVVRATPSRQSSRTGTGYTGGGYSGGGAPYSGGGGGVGANSSGQISAAAPKPPSLADWLSQDSAYASQIAALDKAKADYLAQQGQSKTEYLTNFTRDSDQLGRNREDALGNLENDFAARGLLQSGLYADNMAETNTDFDRKVSDLEAAKANFLAGLTGDLTNFQSEQRITRNKAKADASDRRATKYGL